MESMLSNWRTKSVCKVGFAGPRNVRGTVWPFWNQPNGEVKWRGRKRFVGEAFVGMPVGFKQLNAESYRVYLGRVLLGEMHDADEGGLRPSTFARRRVRAAQQ
jgi:hypothetical protein